MAQTILIAAVAGFAAALLSGMLIPGAMSFAFLFFVAPLPLFIVGFGWHPLAAALAGLFGAILIDLAAGDRGALAFASLLLVPVYSVTAGALRLFGSPDRDPAKDGIATGQLALSTVIYIAFIVIATAIWIEPDYASFTTRLRGFVAEGLKLMNAQGAAGPADAATFNRVVDLMSAVMLPMSALVIIVALVLSGALGAIIAGKAGMISYARPAFPGFRIPGGSLILFAAALIVALWDGYTGVFAEIVALGLALLLMLQGLSLLHFRLRDHSSRGFLLAAAWASILFFGLPALLFIGAGIADHLLDLRNRKGAGG